MTGTIYIFRKMSNFSIKKNFEVTTKELLKAILNIM